MSAQSPSVRRRLADNFKRVRDRIEAACSRVGRDPREVTLVAVTKTVEIDVIRQVLEMGHAHIGENRAQQLNQRAAMLHEFVTRRARLGSSIETPPPRPHWHMIGHLQRNKVKMILPWVELIHSCDSLRLAEEIQHFAEKAERDVEILLQVNTSGERSKSGVAVGAVQHVAEHIAQMSRIRLRGLMTMAPIDATSTEVRLYFNRLRELADDLRHDRLVRPYFDALSMGMTQDYEIAIEAGATMVRLGTALFEGVTAAGSAGTVGVGPVSESGAPRPPTAPAESSTGG